MRSYYEVAFPRRPPDVRKRSNSISILRLHPWHVGAALHGPCLLITQRSQLFDLLKVEVHLHSHGQRWGAKWHFGWSEQIEGKSKWKHRGRWDLLGQKWLGGRS